MDGASLICARCSKEIEEGSGELMLVICQAVSDPTPPKMPVLTADEIREEIDRLLAQLAGTSQVDAERSVADRWTLHFCAGCYRIWRDNPAG